MGPPERVDRIGMYDGCVRRIAVYEVYKETLLVFWSLGFLRLLIHGVYYIMFQYIGLNRGRLLRCMDIDDIVVESAI
jgi:hypothetical protein